MISWGLCQCTSRINANAGRIAPFVGGGKNTANWLKKTTFLKRISLRKIAEG
jgi:hypothetical protein